MPADSKRTAECAGTADIGIGSWVVPGTGRYAPDNKPLPGTPAAIRAAAVARKSGVVAEEVPLVDATQAVEMRLHIGGIPAGVDAAAVASRLAPFGQVRGTAELVEQPDVGFNINPMTGRAKATGSGGGGGGHERSIYAFVDVFISPTALKRCQHAYDGSLWRGKQLTIAVAKRTYTAVLQERWAHEQAYQASLT
jgi:hypothetical protein